MDHIFFISAVFFLIAFAYSTVGFAGGSSYLAILILAGLPYANIPPLALICNLIVAAGSLWNYCRGGHFRFYRVLPFVVLSIPFAYLGGTLTLDQDVFCIFLGLALLMVSIRLLFREESFEGIKPVAWKNAWCFGLPMGALLGFFSGLLGIGGGIFLSPILLFMRWTTLKETAAAASFFILVNSLAGLMGHIQKGFIDLSFIAPLGIAVFVGGQIGSRLGAYRIPSIRLSRVLAALIFCASLKVISEVVG